MDSTRTISDSNFLAGLTLWDKLIFLFNLPFLFIFIIPGNDPQHLKVIVGAIVAIAGIIITTYLSHKKKTSYTPLPERVFSGNGKESKYKNQIAFYEKEVEEEIKYLGSKKTKFLHDEKTKVTDAIDMLRNNKKWNNTQWNTFLKWSKEKTPTDDLVEDYIADMVKAGSKFAKKDAQTSVIIFGVIYAFIAGWAIAQTVITFSNTMTKVDTDENFLNYLNSLVRLQLNQQQFQDLLIFLSFYPVAIIFYHSGAIFLSSDAASMITGGVKGRSLVNFCIILSDGMIIYLMSERATSATPKSFVSLVVLLMLISIVWIIVFRYLDTRDGTVDWPIYMEWLHFDIFVLIFCLILVYAIVPFPTNVSSENLFPSQYDLVPYVSMFCVFVVFAVCNYNFAWDKIWKAFQASD